MPISPTPVCPPPLSLVALLDQRGGGANARSGATDSERVIREGGGPPKREVSGGGGDAVGGGTDRLDLGVPCPSASSLG